MTGIPDMFEPFLIGMGTAIVLVCAGFGARLVSRWAAWRPAGPIALIAAAPLIPRIPIVASLSSDDLLALLGLAMLVRSTPVPRLTRDWLVQGLLLMVVIATVARVASAIANGNGTEDTLLMLIQAVGRPIVLIGIVGYVAAAAPEGHRHSLVAIAVASIGTLEAAFGLVAFTIPLPGDAGMQAARELTSMYGLCRGGISGTLGLSPNHLGAVFVLSIPLTLGLAVRQLGWRRLPWTLAASAQAAALALTFTRSSILLGAAVSVGFLVYERKFSILALMAGVTAVLVAFAFSVGCTPAPGPGPGQPQDPGALFVDRFSDGNDRLALWYSAGRIMLDHPLFGVGLGHMAGVVASEPERYAKTPFGIATSSAHNTVLLAGAETGLFGGVAVLGINVGLGLVVVRCARRSRKRHDPLLLAAAVALGAYLVQGMVNNLFSTPATMAMFALVVGGFLSSRRHAEPEEAETDAADLKRPGLPTKRVAPRSL